MKKTLIALAVLAMSTATFATGSYTPSPVVVTASGSNTVQSATGASASVTGIGSSKATASNTQSALSYVVGSGSLSSKTTTQKLTLENCDPVTVKGTMLSGTVTSGGGVQVAGKSTASVVSTGTGTGAAQAAGSSLANVSGVTTLDKGSLSLVAGGNAGGLVETNTGVVTNGSASSAGSLAASWKATETGSLFTFNDKGIAGDVKNISGTSVATVGGIPEYVAGNKCQPGKCITGDSVATGGAIVIGVANAFTGGTVTNEFTLAVKP